MNEDRIIPTFLLALVAGYILAAFTLHPEKQKEGSHIWYVYERFGLLLSNGVITGLGTLFGQACYYKLKKLFKNDKGSDNI